MMGLYTIVQRNNGSLESFCNGMIWLPLRSIFITLSSLYVRLYGCIGCSCQ